MKQQPFVIEDYDVSIIEDVYLLAGLLTLDSTIHYSPRRNSAGRVVFEVHGRIADDMGRLYAGEPASLATYINHLKSLRAAIFALKRPVNDMGALRQDSAGYMQKVGRVR